MFYDENKILFFVAIAFLVIGVGIGFVIGSTIHETDDFASVDMPRMIASLREAKDLCEGCALIAKAHPGQRTNMPNGMQLYAEAMAQQNAVITLVVTAIQSGMDQDSAAELHNRVNASNHATASFMAWYSPSPAPRPGEAGALAPNLLDGATAVLDALVALQTVASARETERRETLIHEVRGCEWSRWDDLEK
jgi:hypothetical protein